MFRLLREFLAGSQAPPLERIARPDAGAGPGGPAGAISRREFAAAAPLGAALSLAAPLALGEEASRRGGERAPLASGPIDSRFVFFTDPRDEFRALFRFERDLREQAETVSWYHFTMFAVPLDARPQPIVRFEGMEYSYYRRIGDLVYRIHAHNLSFPRDPVSGAFVDEVLNPVSGRRVAVTPMTLLGDPGVLHGPRGYVTLDSATGEWVPAHVLFRVEGELMKLDEIRPAPASWPVNFIETSTVAVARRLFDDAAVTSLPYQTSGFYLFPWPAWTGLGQHPGHMIAAWSGRKLAGVDELPTEFADRARREHPELLAARWRELERPLSPVVQRALQG